MKEAQRGTCLESTMLHPQVACTGTGGIGPDFAAAPHCMAHTELDALEGVAAAVILAAHDSCRVKSEGDLLQSMQKLMPEWPPKYSPPRPLKGLTRRREHQKVLLKSRKHIHPHSASKLESQVQALHRSPHERHYQKSRSTMSKPSVGRLVCVVLGKRLPVLV